MIRKISKIGIFMILLLISATLLYACAENSEDGGIQTVKLSTPQIILSGNEVNWDTVENAEKYFY
jgi:hypothetical protein